MCMHVHTCNIFNNSTPEPYGFHSHHNIESRQGRKHGFSHLLQYCKHRCKANVQWGCHHGKQEYSISNYHSYAQDKETKQGAKL